MRILFLPGPPPLSPSFLINQIRSDQIRLDYSLYIHVFPPPPPLMFYFFLFAVPVHVFLLLLCAVQPAL